MDIWQAKEILQRLESGESSNIRPSWLLNHHNHQHHVNNHQKPEVMIKKEMSFDTKYKLLEELGKGMFGTVQKCHCNETGEMFAAKIVRKTAKSKVEVIREVSNMNQLHHKSIVQIHDAFETNRQMIIVMELVNGKELFEKVVQEDSLLTETQCVYYLKQILYGVQYMHNKKIVHLDLKPENILCIDSPQGLDQIKLIDFGLARDLSSNNQLSCICGTPEFVAPEVINFDPISVQSDMWSLGVIAYVLMSGISPFLGDDDGETLQNVTAGEFDFEDEDGAFDKISEEAKEFISELLCLRPKERLTVEECLNHPWLSNTTGEELLDTTNLKRFIARRRWMRTIHAIKAVGRFTAAASVFGGKNKKPSLASTMLAALKAVEKDENENITDGDLGDRSIETNLHVNHTDIPSKNVCEPEPSIAKTNEHSESIETENNKLDVLNTEKHQSTSKNTGNDQSIQQNEPSIFEQDDMSDLLKQRAERRRRRRHEDEDEDYDIFANIGSSNDENNNSIVQDNVAPIQTEIPAPLNDDDKNTNNDLQKESEENEENTENEITEQSQIADEVNEDLESNESEDQEKVVVVNEKTDLSKERDEVSTNKVKSTDVTNENIETLENSEIIDEIEEAEETEPQSVENDDSVKYLPNSIESGEEINDCKETRNIEREIIEKIVQNDEDKLSSRDETSCFSSEEDMASSKPSEEIPESQKPVKELTKTTSKLSQEIPESQKPIKELTKTTSKLSQELPESQKPIKESTKTTSKRSRETSESQKPIKESTKTTSKRSQETSESQKPLKESMKISSKPLEETAKLTKEEPKLNQLSSEETPEKDPKLPKKTPETSPKPLKQAPEKSPKPPKVGPKTSRKPSKEAPITSPKPSKETSKSNELLKEDTKSSKTRKELPKVLSKPMSPSKTFSKSPALIRKFEQKSEVEKSPSPNRRSSRGSVGSRAKEIHENSGSTKSVKELNNANNNDLEIVKTKEEDKNTLVKKAPPPTPPKTQPKPSRKESARNNSISSKPAMKKYAEENLGVNESKTIESNPSEINGHATEEEKTLDADKIFKNISQLSKNSENDCESKNPDTGKNKEIKGQIKDQNNNESVNKNEDIKNRKLFHKGHTFDHHSNASKTNMAPTQRDKKGIFMKWENRVDSPQLRRASKTGLSDRFKGSSQTQGFVKARRASFNKEAEGEKSTDSDTSNPDSNSPASPQILTRNSITRASLNENSLHSTRKRLVNKPGIASLNSGNVKNRMAIFAKFQKE